ncbi:MAG: flagellar protein FliS [Melioribacter sp.]|uniref:flagellar export chaperone FliS n=1 Tax=Rosettibacter primus TaxID=3111523 RepID=UPI00247E3912|nr:flagellar protein FliS [Melioribacter sp.]
MYTAQTLRNKSNPYIFNQINNATPQELILKVYDFAILNCQKNDMLKTNDAIQVLINSLNFDDPAAKEISIGLLRLYQYCQEQMRKHNNQIVLKILTELRDTWVNALKNMR